MAAASLRWDTIVVDMTSCKLKGSAEGLRLLRNEASDCVCGFF